MDKAGPSTLLEAAHAASSLDAFEQLTLPLLGREIACDQLFFVTAAGISGRALGFDENVRRTTEGRFHRYAGELEPFRLEAASNGGVGVDLEFFGEAALKRTAHYREIMRPHSGRSTLIGYLSFQGEALGGIVFGRSRPGFLEAELRSLREALPALSLARAAFRKRSGKLGTEIAGGCRSNWQRERPPSLVARARRPRVTALLFRTGFRPRRTRRTPGRAGVRGRLG